jgi:C1A family cysteine protease
MAKKQSKPISSASSASHDDEEPKSRFSAFQGHLLESIGGNAANTSISLSEAGITDAEQLVAIAAIPEARPFLLEHLGFTEEELESLLADAVGVLSPQILNTVESPLPPTFPLGALEPTAEMKSAELAFALDAPEAVSLPAAVNLIARMSAIRNQAQRGTCVAFTVTAINEYYRRTLGHVVDLSEQHSYFETKLIDGSPGVCGTWQVKAAQALANRGQCREAIWPYNPNPPCNNHGPLPVNARPNGLSYRLPLQQLPSNNVNLIKTRLANRQPVGISIPVYNSWYLSASVRNTGRITMRLGSEPVAGGHAVCLVGYQDNPASPGGGYFILRNSWGTAWGNLSPYGRGYGTIPYRYIATDCWEAFALAAPVTQEEEEQQDQAEETKPARTLTITVKGDVNLVIT